MLRLFLFFVSLASQDCVFGTSIATMGLCASKHVRRAGFFFHKETSQWWWHWDNSWWRWDPIGGTNIDFGFQEGCWVSQCGQMWHGVNPNKWMEQRQLHKIRVDHKMTHRALLVLLPLSVADGILSLRGQVP